MKSVLVVGGAGYIGGYLVDQLLDQQYKVSVYDSLVYENKYLKDVDFIFGDIRDTQKLVAIANRFDVVVFLAALVGDDACNVDIDLTEEINHQSVKRFCEQVDEKVFVIFTSTCSVFGISHNIVNELSDTNPLSAYASTKLQAEKYVLDRGGCVFRLGTVYGVGDRFSRVRMDLVVNVLTLHAITKQHITVNNGNQYRPVISVKDISGYIIDSIKSSTAGLFILSKENITIKELGKKFQTVFPSVQVDFIDKSFQDVRNYQVDNTKSREFFSFIPTITIENEIEMLSKLLLENRIKNPFQSLYNNGQWVKENLCQML